MKDYVKELMETWNSHGEQAAYSRVRELLHEVRNDVVRLRKQEEAIQALGQVLREHPDVDLSEDPGDVAAGLDLIEPAERPRLIVEAATEIYQDIRGNSFGESEPVLIRAQEVLDTLRRRGLDLGVQQPLAVIGTVLSSATGFHRIARNTFEIQKEKKEVVSLHPVDLVDELPF